MRNNLEKDTQDCSIILGTSCAVPSNLLNSRFEEACAIRIAVLMQ